MKHKFRMRLHLLTVAMNLENSVRVSLIEMANIMVSKENRNDAVFTECPCAAFQCTKFRECMTEDVACQSYDFYTTSNNLIDPKLSWKNHVIQITEFPITSKENLKQDIF